MRKGKDISPSTKLILIAIGVYAFVIVILKLPFIYQATSYYPSDAASYIVAAKQLYLQHTLNAIRPAGIAAIIGFPLLFNASFEYFFEWVFVVNALMWLATIIVFYKALVLIVNKKIAFITSLILITNFSIIIYTSMVLSEIPFVFFINLSAYHLIKYFTHQKLINLNLAILLFFICILIRPTVFYAAIILLFITATYFFIKKYWFGLGTTILYFIIIHLYCMQMNNLYGSYTISNIGKGAIVGYLNIRAKQLKNNTAYFEELNQMNLHVDSLSENEQKEFAATDFKNQIQHNTVNLIKAYCWNLWENSTMGNPNIHANRHDTSKPWRNIFHKVIHVFTVWQNSFLSLLGFVAFVLLQCKWKNKLPKNIYYLLTILLGICVYIFLLSAISFYQHDRFHIVCVPILLIAMATIWQYKFTPSTNAPTR